TCSVAKRTSTFTRSSAFLSWAGRNPTVASAIPANSSLVISDTPSRVVHVGRGRTLRILCGVLRLQWTRRRSPERAAASRALLFLALAFSALRAFFALVGLVFREAALFCVSVLAAAGMPLPSGGGWSLPSLLLVVLLLAAMSGLPKGL